jgi:hypothetical protein
MLAIYKLLHVVLAQDSQVARGANRRPVIPVVEEVMGCSRL